MNWITNEVEERIYRNSRINEMTKHILFFVFLWIPVYPLTASTPPSSSGQGQRLQPSLSKFQFRYQTLEAVLGKSPEANYELSFLNSNLQSFNEKSKGRAFLQSLIIPGWGQHYAESKTMAKVFFVSEILLWGSYVGFTVWSNWLEEDYRTFATTHAGINPEGKPKRYFVDIGNFNDIFDFNQAQLRDRDVSDLYDETNEFFWRWDSEQNRREFEDMRIRSDRAENRAEFTLATIFVNHLISAIHSTLAVHKFNKRLAEKGLGFRIEVEGYSENRQIKVEVVKHF
ncbi:MAG: hypothetical protein ACE5HX_08230 [bacterium]